MPGFSESAVYAFWILFNPFIEVFFGKNMLLGRGTVGVIVAKYYLTGMRKAVLTYRDAYAYTGRTGINHYLKLLST